MCKFKNEKLYCKWELYNQSYNECIDDDKIVIEDLLMAESVLLYIKYINNYDNNDEKLQQKIKNSIILEGYIGLFRKVYSEMKLAISEFSDEKPDLYNLLVKYFNSRSPGDLHNIYNILYFDKKNSDAKFKALKNKKQSEIFSTLIEDINNTLYFSIKKISNNMCEYCNFLNDNNEILRIINKNSNEEKLVFKEPFSYKLISCIFAVSNLSLKKLIFSEMSIIIANKLEKLFSDFQNDKFSNDKGIFNKNDIAIAKKYFLENKSRCFAILNIENRYYYSVSGLDENTGYYSKKSFEKFLNKIANDLIKFDIIPVVLCDDAMRFVERKNNTNIYEKLLTPVLFKHDRKEKKFLREMYSCCERKLLTVVSQEHEFKLYIRYLPCEKCQPAVIQYKNIKLYAMFYNSFDMRNYINDNNARLSYKQCCIDKRYVMSKF